MARSRGSDKGDLHTMPCGQVLEARTGARRRCRPYRAAVRITRTFAELGLDVHLAKVATYGARVVDAFYVRSALGCKVDDDEQVAELDRALRARLLSG